MIFVVFDPSPLTVCINCSFLHLFSYTSPWGPFFCNGGPLRWRPFAMTDLWDGGPLRWRTRITTIQSDHKPLEAIFRKPISGTTPRLQRMLLQLLKFQLNIEYLPGKKIYLADTLSRSYLETPLTPAELNVNDDIEVTVHTIIHVAPISDRMMTVFRDATQQDHTLSQLRTS